ncbi:hypothetical protein [Azotobacter beijerinckii]|uniref:Uncharacterized protein n=1 Tax=Azotobacter beijerinckii TaxID=170623 RepID=A0A1I4G212_9GAMM|nr:hypothetical protein [Azotobacter beijerinckii]SFL23753.1 hypothetical protein SAMN04244574_03638 [Azotobacter beijerinckii]
MTINASDVKLLKSQRLTDEDDGGGRATGTPVVDGEVNNLFSDISRLDRTLGRINLRKGFAGVLTDNADAYLGAHCILTQAPADPRVSVLLFNTGSQIDERTAARSNIENYVVPATAAPFELLGNQLAGQRSITGVQREEHRIPEVGEVYQLVNGTASQYVRVASVEATVENFIYEYSSGQYLTLPRRRLQLGIGSALLATYPGGSVNPAGTTATNAASQPKASVLSTQVADAAKYYGISPLAEAVAQGDLTLKVASVYAPLVPSTVKETALLDQLAGYRRRQYLACGAARAPALSFALVVSGQSRAFLGTGALPGSVTLTINAGVYSDNGKGEFTFVSGSNTFSKITVDYATGQLDAYKATAYTGAASVGYTPATAVSGETVTGEIAVTLASRGYVYTLDLAGAKPKPGTLTVSYLALGNWQELSDAGNGELGGQGSGTVDFASGSVSLTLAALPDVGSAIVYSYVGDNAEAYTQRTGAGTAAKARIRHRLPHDGIQPGSLTASYLVGGVTKTITDTGSGTLSGQASGTIVYATGELDMELTATPDSGSSINYSYQQGSVADQVLSVSPDSAGTVSGTLPGAPLKPGSVRMSWSVLRRQAVPASGSATSYDQTVVLDRSAADDGAGGWVGVTGSIDYSTGAFTLRVEESYAYKEYTYKQTGVFPLVKTERSSTTTSLQEQFGGTLLARAQPAGVGYGTQSDSQSVPPLTFELLPNVDEPIVPGSLILAWGGDTYVDRDGVLYKGINSSTNAGSAVGTVDYAGGTATLSVYPGGKTPGVDVQACLTSNSGFAVVDATFRTPGAPLRPASLQLTAVRTDTAETVTATADTNGNFSGPTIWGTVDVETGIVRLKFTADPNDGSGLSDIPVIPALLRYNAVLYSSLPLNADLIGLDPVRLPADGRVPIYREGDVLVIHHTAETTVASPVAGTTETLARQQQAAIEVVAASGVALDPAQYSVDRELGTVAWANPLILQDASGNPLGLPLTIRDRVEHMAVCSEVQISGALGIGAPLPWDLPAGETQVSSAVAWGDLQARLHTWYTQKTWNSGAPNWTDSPSGESTTSNYNSLNYPPVVTNKGAIAGKWALVFTGTTTFNVVEEKLGVISTGTTGSDCAPINPATGAPYFTILAAGWGSGWAAGNAVRFNTDSCLGPLWIVRTVLSGQGTVEDDQFKLQIRGDAD